MTETNVAAAVKGRVPPSIFTDITGSPVDRLATLAEVRSAFQLAYQARASSEDEEAFDREKSTP